MNTVATSASRSDAEFMRRALALADEAHASAEVPVGAVLVRDGGRCRKCRRAIKLEMDHIVPVSKGGETEESNLQTLCRRCNRAKARKLVPRF